MEDDVSVVSEGLGFVTWRNDRDVNDEYDGLQNENVVVTNWA